MISKQSQIILILCIFVMIFVSGCIGSSNVSNSNDNILGSWEYNSAINNTNVSSTLVFSSDGNFNGFMDGILGLSGHWIKKKLDYNVIYHNTTRDLTLNGVLTLLVRHPPSNLYKTIKSFFKSNKAENPRQNHC